MGKRREGVPESRSDALGPRKRGEDETAAEILLRLAFARGRIIGTLDALPPPG